MGRIKYTKEILQDAVEKCGSVTEVLRYLKLKQAGGTHTHISRKIKGYNLDTSHFKRNKNGSFVGGFKKKPYDKILILRAEGQRITSSLLIRALKDSGTIYKCSNKRCSIVDTWNGKKIILQVDHINANWLDNRKENLRILCPNCHSQTETFGGKRNKRLVKCFDCKVIVTKASKRCRKCANQKQKTKIIWPPIDELITLVFETSYSNVAKFLGVSDNSVRNRIKRYK